MSKYELMVILPGDLTERESTAKLEVIKQYVLENGGVFTDELIWGKRDLAYKIEDQEVGFYAVFHFTLENKAGLKEIQNDLRLDQSVMRDLLIQIDSDYTIADFQDDCAKAAASKAEALSKRKKKKSEEPAKPGARKDAKAEDEKAVAPKAKKSVSNDILSDPDLTL